MTVLGSEASVDATLIPRMPRPVAHGSCHVIQNVVDGRYSVLDRVMAHH
jgi:hypothetical protein